jgi:hypothetical protein
MNLAEYMKLLHELDQLQAAHTVNDKIPVSGTKYEYLDIKWHGSASQARHNLHNLAYRAPYIVDVRTNLTDAHIKDLVDMFLPSAPNMSYIVTHTANYPTFNIPLQLEHGEHIDSGLFGETNPLKFVVGEYLMQLPSPFCLQSAIELFEKLIKAGILVPRNSNDRKFVSIVEFEQQMNAFRLEFNHYDDKELIICTENEQSQTIETMAAHTANVVKQIPLLKKIAERTPNLNASLYLQCHPFVVHAFDPIHLIASMLAQHHQNTRAFVDLPTDIWSRVLASCKVAAAHTQLLNCVLQNKIPRK